MNNLLIVIPALNEEKTIGKILTSITSKFNTLVVSDGSTDKTEDVSRSFGAEVLSLTKKHGVDYAINKAFFYAAKKGYSKIITIDADGQHDVDDLFKISKMLNEDNVDIVISQRNKFPRFSEKLFSLYTKKKINVPDLLSGLKGYKIDLFLKYGAYDTFSSIGTELSFYAVKNKFNYKLINIQVKERQDNPRIGGVLESNLKIIRALTILMYRNFFKKI